MNYEDMSDFEITKKIITTYFIVDFEDLLLNPATKNQTFVEWGDGANWHKIDLCNSWADMGPITSDNKICIDYDFDGSGRGSCTTDTSFFIDFEKGGELRAAAIAFLMSQEGKQ